MRRRSHADITSIKSKVDPRLLIALDVALIVVVGFAAVKVLGGDDQAATAQAEPASSPSGQTGALDGIEPPLDATPVVAEQGEPSSDWGKQATAICGKAIADLLTQAPAATPEAAAEALARGGAVVDQLATLPAEPGTEAEAAEFVALLQSSLDGAEELIAAGGEGDLEQLTAFLEQQATAQARLGQLAADLRAEACISGAPAVEDDGAMAAGATGPESGADGFAELQLALESNDSVVLVVYSPSAELDTRVVREARAGANGGGAGFLAVNGLREADVKALAETFNVRETPATLIINQGLVVSSQFSGFADRETVAQAVRNSLGPS